MLLVVRKTKNKIQKKVINFGQAGVIRCKDCRAYINPFVEFHSNDTQWRCNLCFANNECNKAYYQMLKQRKIFLLNVSFLFFFIFFFFVTLVFLFRNFAIKKKKRKQGNVLHTFCVIKFLGNKI